jgi:hypothetical protein
MTGADPTPRVARISSLGRLRLCSYASPLPVARTFYTGSFLTVLRVVVLDRPWCFRKNGGVGPILFQVSSRPQVLDRRETIETSFRVKRNHMDTMLNDDLSAPRGAAKPAGIDGIIAG